MSSVLSAGAIEEDDDKLGKMATNMPLTSLKRLVGKQSLKRAQAGMPSGRSIMIALWASAIRLPNFGWLLRHQNQCLFRVRNESTCYILFIGRTKPGNRVRINSAARHSETKYGFVVLTGDMFFKDLFVGCSGMNVFECRCQ